MWLCSDRQEGYGNVEIPPEIYNSRDTSRDTQEGLGDGIGDLEGFATPPSTGLMALAPCDPPASILDEDSTHEDSEDFVMGGMASQHNFPVTPLLESTLREDVCEDNSAEDSFEDNSAEDGCEDNTTSFNSMTVYTSFYDSSTQSYFPFPYPVYFDTTPLIPIQLHNNEIITCRMEPDFSDFTDLTCTPDQDNDNDSECSQEDKDRKLDFAVDSQAKEERPSQWEELDCFVKDYRPPGIMFYVMLPITLLPNLLAMA